MIHHFQEICPVYRVEGLGDVKLEEDARRFGLVQLFDVVLDEHEVVMDSSFLDEGTLAPRNDVIEDGREPVR